MSATPYGQRSLSFRTPVNPALVLGRAQPAHHVLTEIANRRNEAVVRRSSGGSAVLLQPGHQVWVDVVVPAGDRLWDDDVGRASWWVGEAWARAVTMLGVPGAVVHHGSMWRRSASDRVCFAGVGAGEVVVGRRKLVGVSQRRTRSWVLFQCALLMRWDPTAVTELLGVDDDLEDVAVGLGDLGLAVTAQTVEEAFLAALPLG